MPDKDSVKRSAVTSSRSKRLALAAAAASAFVCGACGATSSSIGDTHNTDGTRGSSGTITVYNGQHPQLTSALVDAFEKQTGVTVKVRTDDGIVLADQILEEGSHSPADVYLTENSPELMLLSERHLLAKLPSSILHEIPSRDSSPSGTWIGLALRVSSLVYSPTRVSVRTLPATLLDLAKQRWKGKLAIAPSDSDFVPLVGALIARYGTETARKFLIGVKANAALYQDDEAVVAAVNRGTAAVGIVNQYYWYRLRLEVGTVATHSKLYYFPNHDIGSIVNISGAAVLATSKHRATAERFVAFLASAKAQRILAAGDDFEYPARPGIPPNPALPPLASLNPARINVTELGNDLPAAKLLQQVGLV